MSAAAPTVVKPFSWSFSQLKAYETCPLRHLHYNILKDVVEPESDQLAEGNRLHKAFEERVAKGTPLPLGYAQHERMLNKLATAPGKVYAEQKLAMTSQFQPTSWFGKTTWLRTVLDYTNVNNNVAVTLDYKTGKPTQDLTQMQLAAAMLFCHDPKLERVKVALVFLGHDHTEPAEFVRGDLPEIWGEVLPRVKKLEKARAAQDYPAKPSGLCKRWCHVTSCAHCGR